GRFDTIVDARSPAEYAEDRLPGAVNWPSLDDDERAIVGTEYKQVSPFAARKRGAALVARNVAAHVERHVADRPPDWTPLVYCWRGGKRSGALATVLDQIGFRVHVLDGGYRAFRRAVVAELEQLPTRLAWRVVCGPTGAGKSRLLAEIARRGGQLLDLEAIANHRGSVLGLVPGSAQPTQKAFDTSLWHALRALDPARPVFVESESKKIGELHLPASLVERMRASPCLWLELPVEARVALLLEEYDFFVADVDAFCARLDALRTLRGNALVDDWQEAARGGRVAEVVRALLDVHYDPIYLASLGRNFAAMAAPLATLRWNGDSASLAAAAEQAIAAAA
ncbi:MAG: tRNA 2-selenouridine(34) synthase MnmH, partial [Rhizobacter sp.]|nr:tRNA 2-selenouridine(34) synthase MnmH [Rhizobacter sp.]